VSELATTKNARAVRYRRLALAQQNKTIADPLLNSPMNVIGGILCTAEWRSAWPPRKNEQPPQAGDAKF
jgi:hypothetical protein